jgi:hypothetical protein
MPSDHAKFSPSSLKRVMACAASYAHEQALTELEPSPRKAFGAARDGTVAHALAEFALDKGVDPRALAGKTLAVDFDGKAEQVEIEKEVADKVAIYVDHANTLAMLADRRYVEKEVHVTTEVNGHMSSDLLWGTADFIAIADGARIDVVDLKFGMMPVEPENNPQLVAYMLGALELLPESKRPNKGALHIVQPRLSHEPRIWEIEDLAALRSEWLPRFERAMERAIGASMLTVPVEGYYEAGEHCHFCPILVTCSHFAKRMIEITTQELEEVTPEGVLFSDRYVALLERWKAKGLVTRYYDQLEQKLSDEIRKGTKIPGIKIVESLGHRKWAFSDTDMASRLRNRGLKKTDFIVQSIISPAVAEKLIKDKKIIDAWVVRPKSEKLVLDSDRRPAINPGAELEAIEVKPETPSPVARELPPSSPTMALIELGSDGDELEGFEDDEIDELEGFDLGLDIEETEEIQL